MKENHRRVERDGFLWQIEATIIRKPASGSIVFLGRVRENCDSRKPGALGFSTEERGDADGETCRGKGEES